MWSLVEAATGNLIVELVESQTITLGRDSACQVVIGSHLISRQHARVVWADGAAALQDLGSRNGTSLNSVPLEPNQTKPLQHGDLIGLGPWLARVVAHEATLTALHLKPNSDAIQTAATALQLDETRRDVWLKGALLHPPLSAQQFVLLHLLHQANGIWVSREDCARALWPDVKGGDLNESLDGVIKRLRARLREAHAGAPAIEMRRGLGLRLVAG